jgi:NTE family protein
MRLPEGHHKPYRLGLALSGGGARGFAHIGAIRAILDLGLKPDIVAGVSAGSVIAACYGAGMSSTDILDMFHSLRFRNFVDFVVPHEGFMRMNKFKKILEQTIPVKKLEDMKTPTVVCAVDVDAGTNVAFNSGAVAERVIASCSIPIVFEPMEIDGRRYVDGGVLANLPVWPIRHLCKYVIGVNCSPRYVQEPVKSIIGMAQRTYALMAKNNVTQDSEMCDVVVNLTEVATHQVFDLKDIELLVESGYLSTIRTLKQARLVD